MADNRATLDRQRAGYRFLTEAFQADAIDWSKLPTGRKDEVTALVSTSPGRPRKADLLVQYCRDQMAQGNSAFGALHNAQRDFDWVQTVEKSGDNFAALISTGLYVHFRADTGEWGISALPPFR